jgi:hypothetical protein
MGPDTRPVRAREQEVYRPSERERNEKAYRGTIERRGIQQDQGRQERQKRQEQQSYQDSMRGNQRDRERRERQERQQLDHRQWMVRWAEADAMRVQQTSQEIDEALQRRKEILRHLIGEGITVTIAVPTQVDDEIRDMSSAPSS